MGIDVLRYILVGMFSLMVLGLAWLVGIGMGRHMAADRYVPEPQVITIANRETADSKFEEGLGARYEGRYEESLKAFDEAEKLNPEIRGVEYQRGQTMLQMKDYDGAAAAAERSIDNNDETSNARALLAWVAMERVEGGDLAAARGEVEKQAVWSRLADPLNPMPLYVLAEYARATGNAKVAAEFYKKAMERVSELDNDFVTTVKAGLTKMRLNHSPIDPVYEMKGEVAGVVSPEQLYFAMADALLRGDKVRAGEFMERIQEQVPEELVVGLSSDSFFQDFPLDAKVKNKGGMVPSISSPNE